MNQELTSAPIPPGSSPILPPGSRPHIPPLPGSRPPIPPPPLGSRPSILPRLPGSRPPILPPPPVSRPPLPLPPGNRPPLPPPPPGNRPTIPPILPPICSQPLVPPPTEVKPPQPPTGNPPPGSAPIFPPPAPEEIDPELSYPRISEYLGTSYSGFLWPPFDSNTVPLDGALSIRPYYFPPLPNLEPFHLEVEPFRLEVTETPEFDFPPLPFKGVSDTKLKIEVLEKYDTFKSNEVREQRLIPLIDTSTKNNLGSASMGNSKVLTLDEYLEITSWQNYENKLKNKYAGKKSQEAINKDFLKFSTNSKKSDREHIFDNEPQAKSLPNNITNIFNPSVFDRLLTGVNGQSEENEQTGPR